MHGNGSVRRLVPVSVLVGAMAVLLVAPGKVEARGCPPPPYSLGSVLGVPEADRAACFGRAEISFVATGGLVEMVFTVVIDPRYGQPLRFGGPAELVAWKRADLDLSTPDAHALGMTSPGMGLDAWTDVRWRVSGHFDDPIAAGCSQDTNVTPVLTSAEAAEWCRNQFLVDALAWVQQPDTDTDVSEVAPPWDPTGGSSPVEAVLAAIGALAFAAGLSPLGRRGRPGTRSVAR